MWRLGWPSKNMIGGRFALTEHVCQIALSWHLPNVWPIHLSPKHTNHCAPPEGAKLQTLSHRMRCRSPFLPSCIQLAKNHSGLRGEIS
jgi:hypothetical protein